MTETEQYAVAVVGGATAGAEAAAVFSGAGILTVVFEQNSKPYGKIEDGLPRWHVGLRDKECRAIDAKLQLPHVHFVPETKLGCDIGLLELHGDWGFHAVVLSNGAWRDRPLPIEGAEAWIDRGLVYQNAFIGWFNHKDEPDVDRDRYPILDGSVVVGGGLASIDVAKVLQLELTLGALAARGIEQDLVALESRGIPATLESHGLRWEDLGLAGCTIYYRRRPEDMPLVSLPEGASDAQRAKAGRSRIRVLEKAMEKFCFRIEPLHAPTALIIEADRLVGLEFTRTRVEDGKAELTGETTQVRAPMFISSIGSVPEPVEGIPMRGELYAFEDWDLGRLPGFPSLFSAGNVVTGKGNVVASRKHAHRVAGHVREEYLKIADAVQALPPLTPDEVEALCARVSKRQAQVGYSGDYPAWIRSHEPNS